jgi:hypothetical protein
MPPAPPELTINEPEPYRAYASEPAEAALIALPKGRYTIRLRGADGKVVPGSERQLLSFGPFGQGIGYVVRPEDRWTQPAISFGPRDTIYASGAVDLFLQPVPVSEYAAQNFSRLLAPQSVEVADPSVTVWVPGKDKAAAAQPQLLAVSGSSGANVTLPTTPFRVAQTPGVARGYSIEAFTPEPGSPLKPDFVAMRVGAEVAAESVGLVEGDTNVPVAASARQLRRVEAPATAWLFVPALLPFLVGLAVRLTARRPRRRRLQASFAPAAGAGLR